MADRNGYYHEDLPTNMLVCRTLNHPWDVLPSVIAANVVELRCTRCTTLRTDTYNPKSGKVVRRKYEYPDGYKLTETVLKDQLRIEWMARREARLTASEHRNQNKPKKQTRRQNGK